MVAEAQGKGVRLAIIIVVAVVLVGGFLFVKARSDADARTANAAASEVADQLAAVLPGLDYRTTRTAIDVAWVEGRDREGRDQVDFPGRPEISGAEFIGVGTEPDLVRLIFRLSSHGVQRCVVGTIEPSHTETRITDCVGRRIKA